MRLPAVRISSRAAGRSEGPFEKWLQATAVMRKTCIVNRRIFSVESKKKLQRPCREARALER